MTDPITIDLPHSLGQEGARAKLENGFGQIATVIPGASMKSHRWQGNTLHFELEAVGQRVLAQLEVFDTHVHAAVAVPPLVALFASKIKSKLEQLGPKLLR